MNNQVPIQQAKPDAAKLGTAAKTAAKGALVIALYVIGGLVWVLGLAVQAEGGFRGWLVMGLGIALCTAAKSVK
jgi:cytochrome b561